MLATNVLGQPYLAQGYQFGRGIAFDATSNSGYHAADGSYSWTHVVGTGNNQILVVSVGLLSVANSVTALTYNGIALTKLRSDVSVSTTVRTEIWYLVAPATGSHSVSVTLNVANVSGAISSSYNNVDQASPVDAQNGTTAITGAGGGSASVATTTVTDGAWVVDAVATPDTAITVGAAQVQEGNITGAVGSAGQSDEARYPSSPGSVTNSWDNVAALTTWTMSTFAIKPFFGIAQTQGLADSITMSDVLAMNFGKKPSDTLSMSDLAAMNVGKASNDSITMSDSPAKSVGKNISGDSVMMSDNFTDVMTWLRSPTDSVTMTDSNSKAVGKNISGDSVTMSDSPSKAFGKLPSDTLSMSDSITNKAFGKNISDSLTMSDSIAIKFGAQFGLSDTVTITDAVAKNVGKKPSDTVTLSDSIAKSIGKALSDSVTITDFLADLLTEKLGIEITITGQLAVAVLRGENVDKVLRGELEDALLKGGSSDIIFTKVRSLGSTLAGSDTSTTIRE